VAIAFLACVPPGGAARPGKGLDVHVVDERGAALPGLKVIAAYRTEQGLVASACCFWVHLGEAVTGADGVGWLPYPPASSGLMVTTTRPGWPRRTVRWTAFGGLVMTSSPLTVVLGPARDLEGRVELGDCVPGFLDVSVVAVDGDEDDGPVIADVGADGRFVVHGLGPGKHRASLRACGREARVDVDSTGPATLTLPARDPRRPSYPQVRPSVGSARPVIPARPAPPAPCAPATGALVMAGEVDAVALDRRCRFVLAGRNLIEHRQQAASWTLIRPGGAPLPLGSGVRFAPPALGERIAVLQPPAEHMEARVVDVASGAREDTGPLERYALGAADALVLGGVGSGAGAAGADTTLDVRWRDGRRQRLGDKIVSQWRLVGDGRWLVYGVRSGRWLQHVHALDVTTRQDRLLVRDAKVVLPFDGAAAVVIDAGDRLLSWDLAAGGEGRLLVEPAFRWWPLGPDLLVKEESDRRLRIWTRGESRLLPIPLARSMNLAKVRVTADHLLLGADGDAVLVDLTTGEERLLAEGIALDAAADAPLARGSLALFEAPNRALLAPLDGRPARAVGRGRVQSVSPDGAWLAVGPRIDLVSTDGSAPSMPLPARGGTWLPDAPVFLHTGLAAYGDPRPLYAVFPAERRSVTVEPRIVSYVPLAGGEVLVVVPAGGTRPPGVWRVRVPLSR